MTCSIKFTLDQKIALQRFLLRIGERFKNHNVYEMIFGTASSLTTATSMRKKAAEFIETFPEAEKVIREQHNVDD